MRIIKTYEKWMSVKSEINNNELFPMGIKEREIWICNVGENIGFEEDGKRESFSRPILILKVFNKRFCHIIPLSKISKTGKFYHEFDGRTGKVSTGLLSQSKAIDSLRLRRKIGIISKEDFKIIKDKLKEVLEL